MGSRPRNSVEMRSIFIIFILPFQGTSGFLKDCHLKGENYDFGQDYLSWDHATDLSDCFEKCSATLINPCHGITWVHNARRNCALYGSNGVRQGVNRRGQDSYTCSAEIDFKPYQLNSNGRVSCRRDSDCPPDKEYDNCPPETSYGKTTLEHSCVDGGCRQKWSGCCPRTADGNIICNTGIELLDISATG